MALHTSTCATRTFANFPRQDKNGQAADCSARDGCSHCRLCKCHDAAEESSCLLSHLICPCRPSLLASTWRDLGENQWIGAVDSSTRPPSGRKQASPLQLIHAFASGSSSPTAARTTMFKQFAATLAFAVLVLDPASALLAAPSTQLLRAVAAGRQLEAESASTSTDGTLSNPLYEANTKIKGCHWYDYFTPWSCCGTNSC
ncbi:hypothetical protein PHYPSEUDO_015390 [Phytophthora pseudosyringae]|uniref:Uncharacterized protein n=1 Tax=Phytophthora pseudosyringae TaxID=221518 RepID=A0A8T1W3F1_9STRA|nr:hypothetical protein PHYPSEUDO_015390 [Phytophthora pseudosyringae]